MSINSGRQMARPPDMIFMTMSQMISELAQRSKHTKTLVVPCSDLMFGEGEEIDLLVRGERRKLTHWSLTGLCKALKIPAAYARSLPTGVLRMILRQGVIDCGSERLLRISVTTEKPHEVFEVTHVEHKDDLAVPDYEVALSLTKAVDGAKDDWIPDGLISSDRDSRLYLTSKKIVVGSDVLNRGLYTITSEFGGPEFSMGAYLSVESPDRGTPGRLLWAEPNVRRIGLIRRGDTIERLQPGLLNKLAEISPAEAMATVRRAKESRVPEKPTQLILWLKAHKFSEAEAGLIVQAMLMDRARHNLWDLIKSGLRVAFEENLHDDARFEFEIRVGRLMRLA